MSYSLYAQIRPSSKYYEQGLGPNGQPCLLKVDQINQALDGYHFWCSSPYISECYRREDLTFYSGNPEVGELVQLS
ncbi:hypothetical protein [Spartinivicinus ruber]|uniref:hypothetical protein n=1 Tax=Spartinivicinus ruber TaxID=2683272 RepID=UPI0013D2EA5A|nr:hypothetical protein [Spartinivicinus ruber]